MSCIARLLIKVPACPSSTCSALGPAGRGMPCMPGRPPLVRCAAMQCSRHANAQISCLEPLPRPCTAAHNGQPLSLCCARSIAARQPRQRTQPPKASPFLQILDQQPRGSVTACYIGCLNGAELADWEAGQLASTPRGANSQDCKVLPPDDPRPPVHNQGRLRPPLSTLHHEPSGQRHQP